MIQLLRTRMKMIIAQQGELDIIVIAFLGRTGCIRERNRILGSFRD